MSNAVRSNAVGSLAATGWGSGRGISDPRTGARAWVGEAALWRAAIVAGCILAMAVAAWVGHPAEYLEADPALAHLLRGMALIKASIVLGVVGAVLWRCGWRLPSAVGAGYVAGSSVMAGSTLLIWQLNHIVVAAVLFHGAALGMLVLGARER
jgi:hypothetical protein